MSSVIGQLQLSKLLVIEDNFAAAKEIKAFLTANRMVVEVVPTIGRARDFLSVSTYDLIIIDWTLPDGSGVDLLGELRKAGLQTAVLMLTAKSQVQEKCTGFAAGADDYLTKPFHDLELLARVNALLKRPRQRVEEVLKAGDLHLDVASRIVTSKGRRLQLMPMEFALLEFFMRNPGRVFSAECLLERIWEAENESTSHTVVTTIYRLRKKIDSPGVESRIRNQFGMGYSFSAD